MRTLRSVCACVCVGVSAGLAVGCEGAHEADRPAAPGVASTSAELRGGVKAFGAHDGTVGIMMSVVNMFSPGSSASGSPGNGCTGTLVTPRHVLTAAHCKASLRTDVDPGNEARVYSASAQITNDNGDLVPGNPGAGTFWSRRITAATRHPGFVNFSGEGNNNTRQNDLMIVTLDSDVPVSIARPLPIWLGPMSTLGYYRGDLGDGALLVGFGETNKGELRLGPARSVKRYKDACHWYDFGTGVCFGGEIWESDSNANLEFAILNEFQEAGIDHGDSGGPLLFNMPNTGWTIGGVLSGHYEPGSTRYQYHATTGSGWDVDNASWLIEVLGSGDLDNDGIIDSGDNCPPSRCKTNGIPIEDCVNTDQADIDGDGVGDKCDNCPSFPNVDQKNSGGYHEGDACDLCGGKRDKTAFSSVLPDTDGDGVPDACDNCPFVANPRKACSGASTAPGCITSIGLERAQADADADGVGDVCDRCGPGWALAKEGENSNRHAEEREEDAHHGEVPERADVCESVPIAALSKVTKTVLGADAFDENGSQSTETAAAIQLTPIFGRNQPGDPDRTIFGVVDFRFCDCFTDTGTPMPEKDCLKIGKKCGVPSGDFAGSNFKHIPTIRADGNKPPPASYTFRRDARPTIDLEWRWSADLLSGIIPGQSRPVFGFPNRSLLEAHGALVSRVRKTPANTQPGRDTLFSLRDHVQMVSPGFTLEGSKYSPAYELENEDQWKSARFRWPCPDAIDELLALLREPRLSADIGGVPHLDLDGRWLDLTSQWSEETRARLQGKTWLTPVESGFTRRAARVSSQGAAIDATIVPNGFSFGSPVGLIEATEDGLVVRTFGRVEARSSVAKAPPPTPPAPATGPIGGGDPVANFPERSDFAAAFSATRGIVLVAGGTEGDLAAPSPLYAHTIASNAWRELPPAPQQDMASKTFSVGIDVDSNVAYVLDLVPQGGFLKGLTLLRLTRHELDGSGARVVATWPWSGSAKGVHLTVLEDGLVALTVVRNHGWTVFRVDARGSSLKLRGAFSGQGRVVDRPVMGEHEAIVAVTQNGKLRYETLKADRFAGFGSCSF